MKRILSLDGGGIRGVLTLQILKAIEDHFRKERGRPDLVLAEVFDLIAGTSTGAIIAAFLSWGHSVEYVENLYVHRSGEMFCKEPWYRRWKSKYCAAAIADLFKEQFCEGDRSPALMGSKRLRTLLLVVMRNASTGSPWPVTNNPHALFNQASRSDCNLNIPLWQVVRASTAAPTFFPPEQIQLGDERYLFIDGGITPFNNPSLIAVLMATLPQYKLQWETGRDKLHVVSVGTGRFRSRLPRKIAEKIHLMDQLTCLPDALFGSIAAEQDLLCRVLGDCVFGEQLDSEIGDLRSPSLLPGTEQKFTYVRYNPNLDAVPESLTRTPLKKDLDNLQLIPQLQLIGQQFAQDVVKGEHLYPRGG